MGAQDPQRIRHEVNIILWKCMTSGFSVKTVAYHNILVYTEEEDTHFCGFIRLGLALNLVVLQTDREVIQKRNLWGNGKTPSAVFSGHK